MNTYRDPITGYEIRRYPDGPARNTKLYFTPGEYPQLHDITLNDSAAYQVMAAIPAAVLHWAIMRAK